MPYREGKKWRGCVVVQGKRHTNLVATRKEAVEWEAKFRKEMKTVGRKQSVIDLLALCVKYLDFANRYTSKTLAEKEALCKRLLAAWGKDLPIDKITPALVLAYLSKRARKKSANVSNRDRKNLMAMFSFAIKFMGLTSNPVAIVQSLPHDRKAPYTPPIEDVQKVLAIVTHEENVFLTSYLQTGARRSEIFRWKWGEDINFGKREVRLGTRKTQDGSMEYVWLPMSDELYNELFWWKDNHPIKNNPYAFYVNNEASPHHGQPYTTRRKFMSGICKRAGVKAFGFHALRRYVASTLAETHNVSAKTIQRILRHKTVTTTEKYIQNINVDLRSVMNLL